MSRKLQQTFQFLLVTVLAAVPAAADSPKHPSHTNHGDDHAHHAHHGDAHAHHRAQLERPVETRALGGLSIPDVDVVTQNGDSVRFPELVRDKVVVMNFIFTTCTTVCPPMGANFSRLQKELGERAGRDVFLISVSVDPVNDTPERLRAWGEMFGAGPGWTLVTGSKVDVTRLLKDLQVFTPDIRDHAATVILGDAESDTWTRADGLAPPAKLAEILGEIETTSETKGDA